MKLYLCCNMDISNNKTKLLSCSAKVSRNNVSCSQKSQMLPLTVKHVWPDNNIVLYSAATLLLRYCRGNKEKYEMPEF